jgi:hypothetical protein
MIDKIIKGIKYLLDEENLTAEVTAKRNGYEGDFIIPETVVFKKVAYRVTSIGWGAFHNCSSLTSIVIPDGVTSIGEWAFKGCSSLTSVVVAEGNTMYDSREQCNAIIHTATNTLISGCQNTIIPESVKSIGDYAFYGCDSLTSIVIGNGVTSIGEAAFMGCDSLKSITFNGTKMQWNSIELGDEWNCEIPAQIVRCTDGNVKIEECW